MCVSVDLFVRDGVFVHVRDGVCVMVFVHVHGPVSVAPCRAEVLFRQGKFAEALDLHSQALTMRRACHGGSHPRVATSLVNVGNALWRLGRYDDALAAYGDAKAIRTAVYGAGHTEVDEVDRAIAAVQHGREH